jgi:hypothetical protein
LEDLHVMRSLGSAVGVVLLLVLVSGSEQKPDQATPAAQTPTQPSSAATQPALQSNARVFASEAGMIFNAIRPDKVADFELVIDRLRQALAASTDPVRQKQAAGWHVFKAGEAGPNGSVLYVFVIDPAVKGADYGVAKILAEAFPAEAVELYKLYNGAFAGGQTLLNLTPVVEQGTREPRDSGTSGTVPRPDSPGPPKVP